MYLLQRIQAERGRSLLRLRFEATLEQRYRSSQRRRYRVQRVLLFGIMAAGFGLSPFSNTYLFGADAGLQSMLMWIELPVALIAALAAITPVIRIPQLIRQGIQSSAVMAIWGGVLLMRYLSLKIGFDYGSQMIGIVVIGMILFGGFGARRLAYSSTVFFGIAVAIEWFCRTESSAPMIQIYALFFMWLIGGFGAYTQDYLSRSAWLSGQYAKAVARTDPLTGLSSRYDFNRMIRRVFSQGQREKRHIAVMLLDVDHFKKINDGHGHLFGDQVLAAVGKALSVTARRPLDLSARYGGEEFVIVWFDCTEESIPKLAEDVLQSIRDVKMQHPVTGHAVPVTASGGLVWLTPEIGDSAEDVLHQSDQLLYQAKAQGRNQAIVQPYARSP